MEEIIKSIHDKRKYRIIYLENGLRAILVQTSKKIKEIYDGKTVNQVAKKLVKSAINVKKVTAENSKPPPISANKESLPSKEPSRKKSHPKFNVKKKRISSTKFGKQKSKIKVKKNASKSEDIPECTPTDPLPTENDLGAYKKFKLDNDNRPLSLHCVKPEFSKASKEINLDDADDDDEFYSDIDSTDHEASNSEDSEDEDEKEKMASAALTIGVGSFLDPIEVPGLAHLAEHMVFMGSEKFPKENAYDEFVTKHGGFTNAETDNEQTLFILEIHNKHFYQALQMLAHFFISPLMLQNSLDREIEAVDSEFALRAPDDDVRLNLIMTSMAKPGHPLSKFVWGDKTSLKLAPTVDVYSYLHDFCKKYYTAQFMSLALQSPEELDTLESWVRTIFSQIPSSNLERPSFKACGSPFDPSKFCKLYHVFPVKNFHKLIITWSLPSLVEHYKQKPLRIISELVSHEGHGSILAYLRERSWAYSLEAGNAEDGFEHNSFHSLFDISILLSEEGLEHVYEIITLVLEYLELLRNSDLRPIFEEIQTIEYNKFLWHKEDTSSDYVELLSFNLLHYEPQHCLAGDTLYFEFDPDLLSWCLEHMKPPNFNITLLSSSFSKESLPLREPKSQAIYSCSDIPPEWLASWLVLDPSKHPFLHLPPPNRFIPTDFEISKPEIPPTKYPTKIHQDEFGSVWFKKDIKFLKPKAYISYHLINPLLRAHPINGMLMDLFVLWLDQVLCLECYSASLAGLSYTINHMLETGMEILISGFNNKLPLLLETILGYIKSPNINDPHLESLKIKLQKDYKNRLMKSSHLAKKLLHSVLDQDRWTVHSRLALVPQVTTSMLLSFVSDFVSQLYIQCLYQGNLIASQVVAMHTNLCSTLGCHPLPQDKIPQMRDWKIPQGEKILQVASFNKEDPNSVLINYYQCGSDSLQSRCQMKLLMMKMEEPIFDTLRTKEQLGYSVGSRMICMNGSLGFLIRLHSPSNKFSCKYLYERIQTFMTHFAKSFENLTEEEFSEEVDNYVSTLRAEDLQLDEETDRNWHEILTGTLLFDRKDQEMKYLETLTLSEFKHWAGEFFSKPHIFSVQVVGRLDTESTPVTGGNINEDKLSQFELCTLHVPNSEPGLYIKDFDTFAQSLPVFHSMPLC